MVKEAIKIKQMIRSYKTELNVNNQQASKIKMFFGGARFAYNWGLARRKQVYLETKKSIARNSNNAFGDRKLQVTGSNPRTGAYQRKRNKIKNTKFL
jgi:transposase